jgi:hypothetical protein
MGYHQAGQGHPRRHPDAGLILVLFCVDRDHLGFKRNWLVAIPEHRDRGLHRGLDDIAHAVPVLDRQRRQLA